LKRTRLHAEKKEERKKSHTKVWSFDGKIMWDWALGPSSTYLHFKL
jgi:hypothetical protein